MNAIRPPKLIPLARVLSVEFYRVFHSDKDPRVPEFKARDLVRVNCSPNIVAAACEELRKSNILLRKKTNDGSYTFELSPKGITFVERELDSELSDMHAYFFDKECDVNQLLQSNINSIEEGRYPRRMDDWEPLAIDRSSPEYVEAVDQIEAAVNAIEGDNGYAVSDPEERNAVIASIKQGLSMLKTGMPTFAQVRAFVMAPLKMLSEKFAQTLIGEAAKVAGEALVKLLIKSISG